MKYFNVSCCLIVAMLARVSGHSLEGAILIAATFICIQIARLEKT